MGIYVAGMHRSGTSVLARVLGLMVGYEGHRGLGSDNVEGHWELPETNHALEDALNAVGRDWACPPLEPLSSDSPSAAHVDRVTEVVKSLGTTRPWVLKDPRICLAMTSVLASDPEPLVIATYRHPAEVARSLSIRDGFAPLYGIAVWEVYCHLLVRQVTDNGWPTIWTSYDELMADPGHVVDRAASFFKDHGLAVSNDAIGRATSAVNPHLRHNEIGSTTEHLPLLSTQQALLELMARAASGAQPTSSELPGISPWTRDLLATRRPFIQMERDNRMLVHRLRRLRYVVSGYDVARRALGRRTPDDVFVRYPKAPVQ